ncbi:hypothetical protein N9O27_00060 [Flavobacteriaceae bacterium]|nr:hypothetical protein [Flavobacteriaceae bacterium]
MGLLSKVWKGIKKTVKKVGKGIKKVFKKIGGAIGKLGIVGQIGMMFLMPYATSALGSFFGASGKLATWSTKLLGKAGMGSKALGHTLNLINKAGTFAGKVYSGVTETINGAIDRTGNFLKGRGFVKTPVVSSDILAQGVDASQTKFGDGAGNIFDSKGDLITDTGFDKAGFNTKALGTLPPESKNLLDLATDDFTKAITPVDAGKLAVEKGLTVDPTSLLKPKETGLLDKINIFDKDSAIRKDIAEMDIYETGKQYAQETVKESLIGGAKAGLTQKAAEAFGYEQPEGADYYNIDIPDLYDSAATNGSVFKEVDFSMQKSGNNFMVSNFQNSNYLNNLIGEGNSAYDSYMSNFSASQYQPFKVGV